MLHPLSLATYYRRNLGRTSIVIGILGLALFAVIGVAALTGSFKKDAERLVPFYTQYYTISITSTPSQFPTLRSDLGKNLTSDTNHQSYLEGDLLLTKKNSLVGNQVVPVAFFNDQDRDTFLHTLHLKRTSGSFPASGSNDVVLTTKLLDNRKKVLGDLIGDQVDRFDFLTGKYTITGSLASEDGYSNPEFLGLGSSNTPTTTPRAATTFFIRPSEGHHEDLNTALHSWQRSLKDTYPGAKIAIETEYTYQEFIDQNFQFMDIMVGVIMGIITLVMTISVALFNIIIFMQRSTEFGLLLALGYSRAFILRKTLAESLGQIILAVLLGIGLTALVFTILNHIFFAPNGFATLQLWDMRNFYLAIPLPLAVAFFAITTIFSRITRLDPISILENRDWLFSYAWRPLLNLVFFTLIID